jgi:hypothetical protein
MGASCKRAHALLIEHALAVHGAKINNKPRDIFQDRTRGLEGQHSECQLVLALDARCPGTAATVRGSPPERAGSAMISLTAAPDFYINGDFHYPNDGKQIGPAWQRAWELLLSGEPVPFSFLTAQMMFSGGIRIKTAKNLLRDAQKAGILKRLPKRTGNFTAITHYQRAR